MAKATVSTVSEESESLLSNNIADDAEAQNERCVTQHGRIKRWILMDVPVIACSLVLAAMIIALYGYFGGMV
jgi:hypothetical protein